MRLNKIRIHTGLVAAVGLVALTAPPLRSEPTSQPMVPLIINELLARVPSDDPTTMDVIEGDANGDGVRDANGDKFVELVNAGMEPLDLSGFQVDDNGSTEESFVFPMGTMLPPGEAVVIFGDGDLAMSRLEFGNGRALGLVFTTGGRIGTGLSNTADSVVVRDPLGREVARLDYDSSTPVPQPVFQSFNRNPDVTGPFANHRDVPGAGPRAFSPGTRVDGRAFRRLIESVTPNSGPLAGGTQVIIDGAGFGTEIMSVMFGNRLASNIERISPLQLRVVAPPRSAPGVVDVTVTDQFGTIVARGAYTYERDY